MRKRRPSGRHERFSLPGRDNDRATRAFQGGDGGSDPSGDALCRLDDDPLGAAHVAEPVAVLIALQLADKLSAFGLQARDDGVNVFYGECDMANPRCVRRLVLVGALRRRRVKFRQLESRFESQRRARVEIGLSNDKSASVQRSAKSSNLNC
jgi:hypothetical protein